MIDIKKQIEYWIKGAEDDLSTAELLIREKRILPGLFFCHLVIEKAIKAHVVKTSGEVAPSSHNLIYLSEKAGLVFENETEIFIGILMKYQLQGRYPDYNPVLPDILVVNDESSQKRPKANASLRGGTTKQSVAQRDIDCFASLAMTRIPF